MIYEDDHFHPLEKNAVDDVSVNNKDALYNIKKMDKGYHKINRKMNKVWVDGKYYKNITIELYSSGENGSRIRNAISGYRTNSKIGSSDEDSFFKVKLVNSKCSGHLFYDSPEQYEKHQYCLLNSNIKEAWYKKQINKLTKN
jgi:hypothetical protein